MATMNVSLPEIMKSWAEKQSSTGRYSNISDYVRDLIRKDQERQGAIMTIQAAIDEGINSGEPQPFDAESFKTRMRQANG